MSGFESSYGVPTRRHSRSIPPPHSSLCYGAAQQVAPPALSLHIRQLQQPELQSIARHFLALDPADRHARFGGACDDTTITNYVSRIDLSRAVVVAALDIVHGDVVGLAEAQPTPTTQRRVEIAASVYRTYRGRGLALRLVVEVLAAAVARGFDEAECFFDPDNRRTMGLIRAAGASIDVGLHRAEIRNIGDFLDRHSRSTESYGRRESA
jgi:ribosomal protein S18 acetylase RimI-like enzyme